MFDYLSLSLLAQLSVLLTRYPQDTSGQKAEIISAPMEDLIFPLGQTPAVFNCVGRGSYLLWRINGTLVTREREDDLIPHGFSFQKTPVVDDIRNITLTVDVSTGANNNTMIRCHATGVPGPVFSVNITLTIAGPPLAPHPMFHVVNATHIKVQWEKPFVFSEVDIRNYTLYTSSWKSRTTTNETLDASQDTNYPIIHYISNGGVIPRECTYMNFTLIATNDVGCSAEGFATGGFAIAPSEIYTDRDSLSYEVTFTTDFIPMLNINFTFPTVCDYHDATYTIRILNSNGILVHQTIEKTYNKDRPDYVQVKITNHLMKVNMMYIAEIVVKTAVNYTTARFSFSTAPSVTSSQAELTIIIITSVAGLLIIILTGVLTIIFIMRRRKIKLRNRAHQQEVDTEALQRATLSMVTNPIYTGMAIYDEIVDPSLFKSQSKDKEYMDISANTANELGAFLPIDKHRFVEDNDIFQDEAYTVMNPAGCLSRKMKSSVNKGAQATPAPAHCYGSETQTSESAFHSSNRNMEEGHFGSVRQPSIRSNSHVMGSSMPSNPLYLEHEEERYVMGAF